jgi:hypothetical protein
LLAELLFPARRDEPWLGRTGMIVAGVLYALGALASTAIFRLIVAPDFRAPTPLLIGAALVAVALVALSLAWPVTSSVPSAPESLREAPSPWLVGLVAFLTAVAWFVLLDLPHVLRTFPLALAPILAEVALVAGVVALLRRWSARQGWSDSHRLALASAAMLASMLFGFFAVTASNPIDQLGQGVASVVAVVLLAYFAWRLQQRGRGVSRGIPLSDTRTGQGDKVTR